MNPNANRETWLNSLAALMAPRFAELGSSLPPFRVSVGFPSAGMNSAAIGECWDRRASGDDRFEIFIRPDRSDSLDVACVLAHELTHAAVGLQHGHKGAFATVAVALGFPRPLTKFAGPSDALREWLQPFVDQLGAIPHGALTWRNTAGTGVRRGGGGVIPREAPEAGGGVDEDASEAPASSRPKTQTTRLKKAACTECGYTVRVTTKWLEVGPPHCPAHGAMAVDDDAGE